MTLKEIFWIWLVLPILLFGASCTSPSIKNDPPDILLISIDAFRAELEEWRAQRPQLDLGSRPKVELPQGMLEELRALGYIE